MDALTQAQNTIIRSVQEEAYQKETQSIKDQKPIQRDSPLRTLSPFIDRHGLMRVGGRIMEAKIGRDEKQPIG